MYAGAGTAQWDIYGNGELLRMSENSGSSASRIQFDLPTTHRSTSTTTGIAALTAQQEVNNGGYLIFDGKNSSGTSVFNVTHNGRVRVSDGIDFSTNSNASGMTSEVLDDYEEGTFTVTILSGLNVTSYTQTGGNYTKIGNFVTFVIRFQAGGTNVGSHLRIQGLPFNSSVGKYEGSASFGYFGNLTGNNNQDVTMHIPGNADHIDFYNPDGTTFLGNSGNGIAGRTLHIRGFYYT